MGLLDTQNNKDKTKILVVGDHAMVGRGLTLFINREPDLVVCARAADAAQALEVLEKQQVDLAIVDISSIRTDGIHLTKKIKSRYSDLPVLILTIHAEAFYLKRAFQAGARGYITKNEAAETIIIGIHRLLSGRDYVSETMIQKLLKTVYSKGHHGSVGTRH